MEVRQLCETSSRHGARDRADDGLTIVEMMIALTIVMIAFAGLAATLIASFTAIRSNEARVVATALGNELIEEMSTVPWEYLGLDGDELENLTSADLVRLDLTELPDDEYEFEGSRLVQVREADSPAVPALEDDLTRDGRTYTVERYVTWHLANLKRMTVIIRWEVGEREYSIRTEGLRSRNPDDVSDLQVNIASIENVGGGDVQGEDRVPLHPEGHVDEFKNVDAFEVTVWLGIREASAILSFRDRDGDPQVLTTPTTGGGTVQRTFLIPANAYEFRHGNVTFTVTATGPDGETASHAAVLRFYQPVEIQDLRFTQAGSTTSEVEVCNGELQGDLVIDAEVWGLTPAEGAVEGALGLVWGRQPGSGQPLHDVQPDPPVEMTHTDATDSGADFRATIEDGTLLLDSTGAVANGFRIDAKRILGSFDPVTDDYTGHPLDDDDARRAVVINDVCPSP